MGRRKEWKSVKDAWNQFVQGEPRLLFVGGEAGIGKTRLAEEALDWAQQQGQLAAMARAYAGEGELAFAPVADWLRTPSLNQHLSRLSAVWRSELTRLIPELEA